MKILKYLYLPLFILLFSNCEIGGIKKHQTANADNDSIPELSAVDSAFIQLEKKVEPVQIDSVKDASGNNLVWNGEDGLRIEWKKRSNNGPILKGDVVLANFEARVARGEVYDHNMEVGHPLPLKLGVGQLLKGWETALLEMHVGDIGRIMIPSKLAYGENGYYGKVPQNADIIVEIEIVDKVKPILLSEGVKVYKYSTKDTSSSLPVKDQKITFDYFSYRKGKNAGMYDNSYAKGKPFVMQFKNDNLVDGLHQGMGVLRAGDNAFIDIPAELAYGSTGLQELVPPNTPISFDVRIISIK
ncbi:hypothetical protein DNU06_06325 [Putridiphycobacter roseus]|uniref:Peptidyl-prolyl cis-trans isomerase n=1 Tax=Putridiphycobacter roseus TaxID=2219161 RepID=A0A2W1NTZ5_9FLAO|nr:FKBP-type peptidyl-prolyl cis-trans isomerase [Putridiphycobacter roseus]PZE18228.1 hypothetical protein DNU06_06325 [Putridiphycobacter roseus]